MNYLSHKFTFEFLPKFPRIVDFIENEDIGQEADQIDLIVLSYSLFHCLYPQIVIFYEVQGFAGIKKSWIFYFLDSP